MKNGWLIFASLALLLSGISMSSIAYGTSAAVDGASSLSCSANCTCAGADGSASIPLSSTADTQDQALKDATAQCDQFAQMAGAAAGACSVTDFQCH